MAGWKELDGWKEIAAPLGVSPETARSFAARPWDPLPARQLDGGVWARERYVVEWKRRQDDLAAWRHRRPRGRPDLPIIEGWEKIAATLAVSVDVAQLRARRAERIGDKLLPVLGIDAPDLPVPVEHRTGPCERLIGADGLARVWIYGAAAQDWLQSRDRPYVVGAARPRRAEPTAQLALFG